MSTPNQALSLAEVDVRGGSTAGGTLQTAQRIGNAVGAAVITAVFYAAVRGAPAAGAAREEHYGQAYALALAVSVAAGRRGPALAVRERRGRGGCPPRCRRQGGRPRVQAWTPTPSTSRTTTCARCWSVKWTLPPAGVLPAWVAEMDARPCPAVHEAVRAAVDRGRSATRRSTP